MFELARRAPALTTAAVHPGAVLTRTQTRLPAMVNLLVRTVMRPGFMRAEVGALPVLRLAGLPTLSGVSGRFFNRYRLAADVSEPQEAQAFWAACEEMATRRRVD